MATKALKPMMLFMFIAKVIIITVFCASTGYPKPICIKTEKQALMSFKQDLGDPLKKLESWDTAGDEDCCRWDGILCDNVTGHVTELSLNSGSFTGKINPSLLNLTHLTRLDLGSNDFGGINIPTFIGSLVRLKSLNLTQGGFGGLIPNHLGNLSSLQRLELGDGSGSPILRLSINHLKGKNLDWLSSLSSLEYINMNYVNLSESSDHWLFEVNKAPSLVELHLSNCQLRHIIFPPHVNLTYLEVIDLSWNSLQGQLPWAIGNLTSLVSLNLGSNSFGGSIPKSIANLCNLEDFDFSYNLLSGELSKSFEILSGECLSNRLKSIALDETARGGQISDLIGVFKSLEHLSLSRNNISGSLPVSIGKLKALKSLNVYFNRLSGTIPENLGSLSNLEIITLSENQLSGPIPKTIGSLRGLKSMFIASNQLSGSLPDSFGSLSNLESIIIQSNQLEGEVSEVHFANLTKLTCLRAYDNKLTLKVSPDWIPPFGLDELSIGSWRLGPLFPMWLKTQTNLTLLDLSNTGISDAIPIWLWNLSSLQPMVDLSENQIYGQIPNFHGFRAMYLNGNKLNGSLPRISSGTTTLDLSNNSLSGEMSSFLCIPTKKLGQFRVLILKDNLLSGKIPDCWNYWSEMFVEVIDLSNNNLSGEIPRSMGLLRDLKSLNLRNNSFSGEIPKFLKKNSALTTLDLGLNDFVGNLPTSLASLQNLYLLSLRSNKLSGEIPTELCALPSIQILDIANNNISGVIPKCFKNLTAMSTQPKLKPYIFGNWIWLEYALVAHDKVVDNGNLVTKNQELKYGGIISLVVLLDLSSNNLSGEIPEEITSLNGLNSLNLSRNSFRGHIPVGIGKLMHLESLDLSRNQLSGPIPPSVTSLTFLAYFDLSHNNLSGRIPTGTQLQGFDASKFIGNQLCGPPLTKECGEGDRNTTSEGGDRAGKNEEDYWFRLGIAVGFGVGFLGIILPLCCSRIWRMAYFWFFQEYLWYKIVDSVIYIFKT